MHNWRRWRDRARSVGLSMPVRDYAVLQFDGVCLRLPQENPAAIGMASTREAGGAMPGVIATLQAAAA